MGIARSLNLLGKVTVLIILGCSLSIQAKYSGGTGEPNYPYLIYDANHMQSIGADQNDWDKHFKLMADINLDAYTGDAFNIIGVGRFECTLELCRFVGTPFTGVFDGNGHTISNFTYEYSGDEFVGLLGCVDGENAQIKNLRLIDPNVDAGKDCVGSLVGYFRDGTITGCCVEGGSISGNRVVGGLIGSTGSTTQISNCHATGNILGQYYIGGLVGTNSGTISNCYSKASAMGVNEVGGIAGINRGTITDCYSMGSVGGNDFVGGLVGRNGFYYELDCYPGSIISSYWDPQTSGEPNMCGSQAACSSGCDPNYGKTTAEMKQQSTFTDWDFINVWNIGENQTYPYLRTFLAGDINKDGIVNFFDFAIEADQWLKEQ